MTLLEAIKAIHQAEVEEELLAMARKSSAFYHYNYLTNPPWYRGKAGAKPNSTTVGNGVQKNPHTTGGI